ncbi:unnamed protein product, partial [Scytosiphon promiscuus]
MGAGETPGPSPAGQFASEGGRTPPVLILGNSHLGKSPLGKSPIVTTTPSSSGGLPRGGGDGSSRQHGQEGKYSPSGAIMRTSSEGVRRTSGQAGGGTGDAEKRTFDDWGKALPKKSSPRAVPRGGKGGKDSSLYLEGVKTGGGGSGKMLGRSPLATATAAPGWPSTQASSSLEQQQQQSAVRAAALKGEKLGVPLGRRPQRPPTGYPANSRSHESTGNAFQAQGQGHLTPTGLSSDNTSNDAFERDGRFQASYGSAGSASGSGKDSSTTRSRGGTADSAFGLSKLSSDASGGGGGSGGKSRPIVAEHEFNPFQTADEQQQLLKVRTHNRRRWSHVFSRGEKEFQTTLTMPGPIYRSLCQPVLLPTSIDYVPTLKV